jgi:N-acetyltransferase 10
MFHNFYLQVCLEGQISRQSAIQSLSHGHQPSGDQIPWKFCEQFRDTVFPSLSGARIVRIATHPNALGVTSIFSYGYCLTQFY